MTINFNWNRLINQNFYAFSNQQKKINTLVTFYLPNECWEAYAIKLQTR